MKPKNAIIILLILAVVVAMTFAFLYTKNQAELEKAKKELDKLSQVGAVQEDLTQEEKRDELLKVMQAAEKENPSETEEKNEKSREERKKKILEMMQQAEKENPSVFQ